MVNVTWQEQNQSICPVFDILHSIMQTRAAIDLGEAVGLGNNGLLGELSININGDMGEGWMDESKAATINQEIELEGEDSLTQEIVVLGRKETGNGEETVSCTTSTDDAAVSGTDTGVSANGIDGLGIMALSTSGKHAAIAR